MDTFTVYRIYNTVDGKSYVGQSATPKQRINVHLSALRIGKHKNPLFQKAFNEYGEAAFKAEILETNILIQEADNREIYWIVQLDACPNGYNQRIRGTERLESQPLEYQELTHEYRALWETRHAIEADYKKLMNEMRRETRDIEKRQSEINKRKREILKELKAKKQSS